MKTRDGNLSVLWLIFIDLYDKKYITIKLDLHSNHATIS